MKTVLFRWKEVAIYEMEVEVDDDFPDDPEEDDWFSVVDGENPEWIRDNLTAVEDRELIHMEVKHE